jgi:hypothetical protein
MASQKRNRGHAAFRPEDELDELFGSGNPNPNRAGCPEAGMLLKASRKALPIDDPVYDHLGVCSNCYRQFRQYQQSARHAARLRRVLAVAAVVLLAAIGAWYTGRGVGIGPWKNLTPSGPTQTLVLDYRTVSPTRSEDGNPSRPAKELPRANVHATILLPIGSEPGRYELRIVDGKGRVRLEKRVMAELKDFADTMDLYADLRSFAKGTYSLDWRRPGEDWDPHPMIIQ